MAGPEKDLQQQIVDDVLTCCLCLDIFDSELKKPKSLKCRHIFCMGCLIQHVASGKRRRGQGGWTTFDCPTCRKEVNLPPEGVEGLPDDLTVLGLTDTVLNKGAVKLTRKDDENCSKDGMPPQLIDNCPKHPRETLRMFCNRCAMPVCAECVENEHDGHSTSGIKKVAGLSKENLNPLLSEGKWKTEELGGHLKGLQYAEERLQASREAATADVQKLGRTLKSEIDSIVANILGVIEGRYQNQLQILTKEKDSASGKLEELSRICSGVESELKNSTHSRIVEKEQEMGDKLKQVVSQDVPVSQDVLTLGFKASRTKLSDLLFGEVTETVERVDRESFTNHILSQVGGDGIILNPGGVTTWDDEVYVVDRGNKQIHVFDYHGNSRRSFSTDVFGKGSEPQDVCVTIFENESRVLVTDKREQGLRIFDKYGTCIDRVGNVCMGPMGLTVSKQNQALIVVDEDTNCVRIGLPCPALGCLGSSANYSHSFNHPFGITTSLKGKIFISDCQNHCIKVLSPQGAHLHTFGSEGGGEGQLRHPLGVDCDDQGRILIADSGNRRVEVFSEEGEFVAHAVTAEDGLGCPVGVALLQERNTLVVTDALTDKLLFLRYS
ncbi:tripartite motif-containing protein 2-like [Branchiostoma floridae x Branchiostoma japonicum]